MPVHVRVKIRILCLAQVSDGPISRFRFYGENVGRSFIVCSHDPIFKTNKESLFWGQNDHSDIMQKLAGAFHNRACSISIHFFKITDPYVGRSFSMCSHHPIFGTNKNRILKNGSCERAFRSTLKERQKLHQGQSTIYQERCKDSRNGNENSK